MSHGSKQIDIIAPRSPQYQGPFGRICPELNPWVPPNTDIDSYLLDIANDQMTELPGKTPADIASDTDIIKQLEDDFGSDVPAGYTYFGQFIDHDITFDPTSSLMRQNDPNSLLNFRTPRLDLDNIYGRGPDDQPYLYDKDKEKLLVGQVAGSNLPDLQRNSQGRAIIGDMRNDENSIVSQLQLAFILAHNTLVQRARDNGHAVPFESARKTLRWLYQFVVWNDFLKRISRQDIHQCALELETLCGGRKAWKLGLADVYKWKNAPFMPVEFSVAAYRFGHSMVRNSYQTNDPHRGFQEFAPIFDNRGATDPDDLRGFRPMKKGNVIQWDWFLQMTSSGGPFPQMARKIDTKLSNALAALHEDAAGSPLNILAFRNLKRGLAFGLPSGSDVARKFCLPVVNLQPEQPDALWFYILREAEAETSGDTLGALGSTIVCATFAGLLKGDPKSYLNMEPCWHPDQDDLLISGTDNIDAPSWSLASIIRLSGLPVDSGDVSNQT